MTAVAHDRLPAPRITRVRSENGYRGVFVGADGQVQWTTPLLVRPTAVIEAVVAFGRAATGKAVTIHHDKGGAVVIFRNGSGPGVELPVIDRDLRTGR